MCKRCDGIDVQIERYSGVRAALSRKVQICCHECKTPCRTVFAGLGDKVFIGGRLVAVVDTDTESIWV